MAPIAAKGCEHPNTANRSRLGQSKGGLRREVSGVPALSEWLMRKVAGHCGEVQAQANAR